MVDQSTLYRPSAPTLKLITGVERVLMEGSPPQSSAGLASAQKCCCFLQEVKGTVTDSLLLRWQMPCGIGSWDLPFGCLGLEQERKRGRTF